MYDIYIYVCIYIFAVLWGMNNIYVYMLYIYIYIIYMCVNSKRDSHIVSKQLK